MEREHDHLDEAIDREWLDLVEDGDDGPGCGRQFPDDLGDPRGGPEPARDLACRFRRDGFRPGIPPGVSAAAVRIDRETCARARCPDCDRRGLEYRPFTDGRGYRVVAACRRCGAAEEF
jgi:hypothetical protein